MNKKTGVTFSIREVGRKIAHIRGRFVLSIWSFTKSVISARPVFYALLVEAVEIALLAFAALLTVEAVLPGIISLRLNLATPFLVILILIAVTAALGRSLGTTFPFVPNKKSPLTWIGISWLAFLLTLSTIHFSYWAVPVIVGSLFIIAHFFWKILFRNE